MDSEEDLADRLDDLEASLEELRRELVAPRRPVRPPTPGELLRLAGDYGVPALIAALEAQIRALELLRELLTTVSAVDGERERAASRVDAAGGRLLERLDETLADVQEAVRGGDVPGNPEADRLLTEARALSEEVRSELVGPESDAPAPDTAEEVPVDVEEELQTIRREVGDDGDDGSE